MSYAKIDKEGLQAIKDDIDTEIEKLTTNFSTVTTNIPSPRNLEDPLLIEVNNKEGTDYVTIGQNYNDAITNIKNNIDTNTIVDRLTKVSTKMQTIIDAIDTFNGVSFTEIENEIKELSDTLTYLDEFSDLDRVELYTITDYSAGKQNEEKEEEKKEEQREENGESGNNTEKKIDDNPTGLGEDNGEEGSTREKKFDEDHISPGEENGEEGTPIPKKRDNTFDMHGIAPDDGTPPDTEEEVNKKDPALINGSSGNLPEKNEDNNNSNSDQNGNNGSLTESKSDGKLNDSGNKNGEEGTSQPEEEDRNYNPFESVGESDESTTKDDDNSESENENGESGSDKETTDEGEEPFQSVGNNGDITEDQEDTTPNEGNDNNENGISGILNNNILETNLDTNNESGNPEPNEDSLVPDSVGNGLTGGENSTEDEENANIGKMGDLGLGGMRYIDTGTNSFNQNNETGNNNSHSNQEDEPSMNIDENNNNQDSDNVDSLWKKSLSSSASSPAVNPITGMGTTGGESDKHESSTGKPNLDSDINKGPIGTTTNEYNGLENFNRKSGITFIGALMSVIGGIFGIKNNKKNKNGSTSQEGGKTTKGFFENVKNFFKDIFGKNKEGFKGKDNSSIDTIGRNETSKSNGRSSFFESDNSDYNSGKSKGKTSKDKNNDRFKILRRYRSIIRVLTVIDIPGLIALAIAKIISYWWLLLLLILLLIIIATFYTMFKEEKEKTEEENEEIEKEDLKE